MKEKTNSFLRCPACGTTVEKYKNPVPTVDVIVELEGRGIVLIKRKNPPYGWAIPGGFIDYGESIEEAAVREAKEEVSLEVDLVQQLHTYSDPTRDKRHHTITTVCIVKATGEPIASDDAAEVGVFNEKNLPEPLVFDHAKILKDYFLKRKG